MKILKFKLALIILLLICSVTHGQHSDVEHIYVNSTSLTSVDLTSKKLVGSSYIDKDFLSAKISNNQTVYLIRYNAYLDEMEVEIDGKSFNLPKSNNYTITFDGNKKLYKILVYNEQGVEKKGFFLVLTSGDNISLLIKEKIKLHDEVPAKLGFTRYEPPTLKRAKDKLYFGYIGNTAVELPKKKKEFYAIFKTKSKEVEKYVKTEKISIKSNEDLVQLFEYYNSLK